MFLSHMDVSLPSSLSKINKHVLGQGVKKKTTFTTCQAFYIYYTQFADWDTKVQGGSVTYPKSQNYYDSNQSCLMYLTIISPPKGFVSTDRIRACTKGYLNDARAPGPAISPSQKLQAN